MGHISTNVLVTLCLVVSALARPAEDQSGKTITSYLPGWGAAKGQYLEVTKDKSGAIIKESVISKNEVKDFSTVIKPVYTEKPKEQANKNIFEQNLHSVHASAQKILALHQIAKKKGNLSPTEMDQLKTELNYLSESAGTLTSLSESASYDIAAILGQKNHHDDSKFEENVGEEGISVDSPLQGSSENPDSSEPQPPGSTVAEAKPVGLAIAGDGGQALSKPVATAVVASGGVAIARPIATAIAGVDPSVLGVGSIIYGKI